MVIALVAFLIKEISYHTRLSSKYSITSHLAQNGTFLPKSMKEWESLQDC